jgi:hypothetical protein
MAVTQPQDPTKETTEVRASCSSEDGGMPRRVPDDPTFVTLNRREELAYWCATFDVTAQQLAEAVIQVGSSSIRISAYLRVQRGVEVIRGKKWTKDGDFGAACVAHGGPASRERATILTCPPPEVRATTQQGLS